MKRSLFFTSGKGNSYLYSPYRKQILATHPLLKHFHQLDQQQINFDQWISSNSQDDSVTIPEIGTFPLQEVQYQKRKYRFLKKNGFFRPEKKLSLDGRLLKADIRKNIASVKQIIFEVTEDCNLNCTYCTYGKYYENKPRSNRYLTFEMARPALEHLISIRPSSPDNQLIISFYGGEPLKNFAFIQSVVDFTRQYEKEQISFRFSLTTNGLLLKKHLDFLVANEFEISLSLDGDEQANSFRVTKNNKQSYQQVISAITHIKENYPGYFEKNVNFITVMHKRNSMEGVYDFFMQNFGKLPMMSEVNPVNVCQEFRQEFRERISPVAVPALEHPTAIDKLGNRHPGIREMARAVEYYSGFVFKNIPELLSPSKGQTRKKHLLPTATCAPFSIRVFFTAEDTIVPCEHINPVFEIGSYSADKLNLDPSSIASLYNRYYDKMLKFCTTCYFADNCQECMFNAGIENEHPSCAFYTRESGFRQYLSKQISNIEDNFNLFLQTAQSAYYEH